MGNALADEQQSLGFDRRLRGAWGKLNSFTARLALVLHYLWLVSETPVEVPLTEPCGELAPESMERATQLIEYFKSHFRGVLSRMPLGSEDRKVLDFCDWVRNDCQGRVRVREIYRTKKFSCRGKSDAMKLCQLASDRGYGILAIDPKNKMETFTLVTEA